MTERRIVEGPAVALAIENLDTDQIMPKQFLRGIDKAGLDQGLLWDLRFDGEGQARPDFVLNRSAYAGTRVLIGGANFGCGSSREHAVWGLQQYGIAAVIAPSFGEIFYSNAMNNRLLAVMLPPDDVAALMHEAQAGAQPLRLMIDVQSASVHGPGHQIQFALSPRHQRMLIEGLDMIGATLKHQGVIEAFARRHRADHPWLADVASRTRLRLDAKA